MDYAKIFFETYFPYEKGIQVEIVEIGSQDVNGSLREVAPLNSRYIGLDFIGGKGVDIVIDDPYKLSLPDESADVVISTSCFEHSEFFWLTFNEVLRILRPNGFVYINVPSNGIYHRYPVDCWRFFPDSGEALAAWGRRSGYDVKLIESFIGKRSCEGIWNDFVAIFQKGSSDSSPPSAYMLDRIDGYKNAHVKDQLIKFSEYNDEHEKIAAQKLLIAKLEDQISSKNMLLSDLQMQLAAEKENASSQILYRDALLMDLQLQLAAEKENASSQILYRDALLMDLQLHLAAEKENSRSQILYRDAMVAELHEQLEKSSRSLFGRLRMLLRTLSR